MYWRRYSTLQVASGLSGVYADGETGQEKIEVAKDSINNMGLFLRKVT